MVGSMSPTLRKLSPLADEDVVARVVGGDTAAFELLMRRHNQRLFRLARAILGNDVDAEEVVQEAYVRASGALAGFEGRSSVATWLSRITLHEALRLRRHRGRTMLAEPSDLDRAASRDVCQPGEPLDRAEERHMLGDALDSLQPLARAVVMLRLVEGLSTRETAESLEMSESNVKVSLHRAKGQLRDLLERRAVDQLRERFAFAEERCDRIVARVFERLDARL